MTQCILVNKDRHMRLKEEFPTEINPLGMAVRSEPWASVVSYEELKIGTY